MANGDFRLREVMVTLKEYNHKKCKNGIKMQG